MTWQVQVQKNRGSKWGPFRIQEVSQCGDWETVDMPSFKQRWEAVEMCSALRKLVCEGRWRIRWA